MTAKETIQQGKAILGIEFGSTRIKAVLIDEENKPIAQGSHDWENQLVDGLWTYSVEAIWYGLQDCYANLRADVLKQYDTEIEILAGIGVSAMMHGYMAFNEKEEILVPFRTWRNTNTAKAAAALSELFVYNIPLRWSISHLYEAILDVHFDRRNFYNKMRRLEMLEQLEETANPSRKKEAFLFRFNKSKYDELKQKGFRLEF